MSTSETPASAGQPRSAAWIVRMEERRKQIGYALLGVGAVMALAAAWIGYKYQWDYAAFAVWGGLVALVAVGTGQWVLWGSSVGVSPEVRAQRAEALGGLEDMHVVLLLVGGLGGFATWTLSLALAYQ